MLAKKIFTICSVAVFVAGGLLCAATPAHSATMTLKVSHQFAVGDVRDQMAHAFGNMVTKLTHGQIQFRYYPASSLFKATEEWDALRNGSLDLAVLPLDYASGEVPQLDITLMPCTVSSLKEGMSWRNKPIGKKVDEFMEKDGVRNLVWAWFAGGTGSNVRQIILPKDVKGTKARAAGRQFEYMMQQAGASITSMPSSEVYHALSTGVLNTMLTSSASFVSYKLYEVLKYINIPRNYAIWQMAENLIMSQKTWKRLTPSQKKAFRESAEYIQAKWIPKHFKGLVSSEINAFTKAGAKIHYMNKKEFNVWLAFAQKTAWKHFADTVPHGQELLNLALAAMK